MKILACHPGAAISTADVYNGIVPALRVNGAEVIEYRLDHRLKRADEWLKFRWKRSGLPREQAPTWADTCFQAGWDACGWALYHAVDAVLIVSGMYLHPDMLVLMRRAGLHVGLLLTESPYDVEEEARLAPLADVVWTNERTSVARLRQANPNTHYLRHAYDAETHKPLAVAGDVPSHDVLFVGTGFQERIDLLAAVDWTGINLGLYGAWDLLPSRHRLRKHVRGAFVSNADAANLYRAARVNLNLFRTSRGYGHDVPRIDHAESLGPRLYELAAIGAFALSDFRAEVVETFGPSVPTFSTTDQLGDLARRFLADPDARAAHARAAREAIAPHTFAARAAQVLAQLEQTLTRAHARGASSA